LSSGSENVYDVVMPLEIARLCLGMLIAGFHTQIADFILKREYSLILAFRERGVELPTAISRKTAHNIYFSLGILIALIELLRLHQLAG
jgi:hypothetical protein